MDECACASSRNQRILRPVLKVPAAERASVDVDRRCQPDAYVVLLCLQCGCLSDLRDQFGIPGAGQSRRAWERRRVHTALRPEPHAGGSVRCHYIRYAILFKIPESEGICNAPVRLTAEQVDQLIQRQLIHEFVQRMTSVCDIVKQNPVSAQMRIELLQKGTLAGIPVLRRCRQRSLRHWRIQLRLGPFLLICLKRLKASVCQHSPAQSVRNTLRTLLLQNPCLIQCPLIRNP